MYTTLLPIKLIQIARKYAQLLSVAGMIFIVLGTYSFFDYRSIRIQRDLQREMNIVGSVSNAVEIRRHLMHKPGSTYIEVVSSSNSILRV